MAASNAQKTPFNRALTQIAQKQAGDADHLTGRALPCSVVSVSGAIITVKFEINSKFTLPNVTIPLATSQYARYPIKAGDKGVAISADAYIGGISGLGGGTADLSTRANLTNLIFLPIGSKSWPAVAADQVTFSAPNGVLLKDDAGDCEINITATGISIKLPAGKTINVLNLPASGSASGDLYQSAGAVKVVP